MTIKKKRTNISNYTTKNTKIKKNIKYDILAIFLLLLLILGIKYIHQSSKSIIGTYDVVRVKDGDTLVIDMDNEEVTVRLIGIDAPESVHPYAERNSEEGKIVSDYMKELLEGKQVKIELDEGEYDQYGRLLAYVYFDEIMVNELLLEKGYARTMTVKPNDKYQEYFLILEGKSKRNKEGFWLNYFE